MEYELVDTGVFADDRYFDVEVEYAKAAPDDLVCRISVHNRGHSDAPIHVLPTLWFRNTWSWPPRDPRPVLARVDAAHPVVRADHRELGTMCLHAEPGATLLFCENESNAERLWRTERATLFVKDGINDHVVDGADSVNPAATGTKAAVHARLVVPAGGTASMLVRLTPDGPDALAAPFADVDELLAIRRAEADAFYDAITPPPVSADAKAVLRQALAGMLWSKQCYNFDLDIWLQERHAHPLRSPLRRGSRNEAWFHMVNHDVISMPDTWEYPWYTAWDLAFHCVPLAMVDPDFAKSQLDLMLSQVYLHPSGQMPAYEWNFGDVNPPVHAFATLFLHNVASDLGDADLPYLRESFTRLLMNFTWWVNRKDPMGKNVFQGGFLGLDNIGVFDRSAPLPTGGSLEQADGTAWMALFSQNMLEVAVTRAGQDERYDDFVLKFVEHFFWIAAAVDPVGVHPDEMWDDEDGFFYDVLRFPDGHGERIKVRSLVGLLPLCASTVISADSFDRHPELTRRVRMYLERNRDLLANIADPLEPGVHDSAGSTTGMFGGNSNWRGPVWFPVNLLIIRALLQDYRYYGDGFEVECPTGSGTMMNLFEVARELANRLIATFLRGPDGRRPVYAGTTMFQDDPHWRDLILFYDYFHGDNGAGLGASHQTGWTGVVAALIQLFGQLDAASVLESKGCPFASPYRPLAGEQEADIHKAREAQGVHHG